MLAQSELCHFSNIGQGKGLGGVKQIRGAYVKECELLRRYSSVTPIEGATIYQRNIGIMIISIKKGRIV